MYTNFQILILTYFVGLQNDHKAIMKKIEAGLVNYYDPNNKSTSSTNNPMDTTPVSTAPVYTDPFAKINLVHEGSPSDLAVCRILKLMYFYEEMPFSELESG